MHVAALVEQDRLVVAGLVHLNLREDAVEVLTGRLGRRDQLRRGHQTVDQPYLESARAVQRLAL